MSEIKKVKIQSIIESQIPEFLNEESPLFKEFLKQYYISQEYETGMIDFGENIKKYKSIETFNNEIFYTKFTSSTLTSEISSFDDVIPVSHTIGFPEKNGLIKIENEIIYYQEKDSNSFIGCLRGFSGLSKNISNEFIFSQTTSEIHQNESEVINISLQFFEELFKKFKSQYLPGFEDRNFVEDVDLKLILAKARDFYTSKGTDISFELLFNILFNKSISITNPFDYTLKPSSNEYISTKNILVEPITEENLLSLKGKTIYQNSSNDEISSASIYNVEYRGIGKKNYYELSLDPESFFGNITATKKTFLTENISVGSTVITVDSTIGFPNSGEIIIKSKNLISSITLQYKNKTLNQFLEVEPIGYELSFNDSIIENNLAYSYIENDKTVYYRVCNTISDVDTSKTFGLRKDDFIKISSISKNYDSKVELINWDYNVSIENNPSKKANSLNITGISSIPTGIQNTYINNFETEVYVTSSGLPNYTFSADKRSFSFSPLNSGVGSTTILASQTNHNLITGERLYFYGNLVGIQTGLYFITKLSNNTISLSYSNFDVYAKKYIPLQFVEGSYSLNAIKSSYEDTKEESPKALKHQNLLKKINIEKDRIEDSNIPKLTNNKRIGILRNGVEICSPSIFNESIYYGKIESIDIVSPGKNYDVINKPEIEISDLSGKNAEGFINLSGSLKEVKVISPGVGFEKKPKISLIGGNGVGAVLDSNFVKQRIESFFNGFNGTSGDIVTFLNNHNFFDGEEIFYLNNSNPNITPLKNNSNYFVKLIDSKRVKLYNSKNDALNGINAITFTSISEGFHSFKTVNSKNVINKIYIKNSGKNYSNYKSVVNSPTSGILDEFENSGISIHDDYIFSKNHLFSDGDQVVYNSIGTPISGLSTNSVYYIKKIDNNRFKLSLNEKDLNEKKYINITGIGTGQHTFSSPPIQIFVEAISGIGSTEASYPILNPIVLGEIKSINLTNPGVGYGSSNIINFNNPPLVEIKKPSKECILKPIILDGSIVDVQIINSGFGYTDDIDIIISGKGNYAELVPVIQNSKIVSINIINRGKGYDNKTTLIVEKRGFGAKFFANITEWTINQVVKNKNIIASEENGEGILIPSYNENFGLEYVNFYPPKLLRDELNDNGSRHSPILGWSYDGHPIYGPFGYTNINGSGIIKSMVSGYNQISISNFNSLLLRPPFENGFFIQDYKYEINADTDLDEYNGRYCVTPEFPNGVYAYFSTFLDKNESNDITNDLYSVFPYVIGNKFKNSPEKENFNPLFNQINFENFSINLIRNTYPYNTNYPILSDFAKEYKQEYKVKEIVESGIDNFKIYNPGNDYKVGDKLNFDNKNSGGFGASAVISRVKGKNITSFNIGISTIKNVKFINNLNSIVAITSTPHNFISGESVIVSSISSSDFSYIEGIKKIEVNQKSSTLIETLPSQSITGVTTYIKVSDLTGFDTDDYIKINSEILTINYINKNENKIYVNRYDNFSGIHTAGISSVILLPNKFNFVEKSFIQNSDKLVDNKKVYFDPSITIGIGTTGTEYKKIIGICTEIGSFVALDDYNIGINTSLIKVGDLLSGNFIQSGTIVTNVGIGSITIDLSHTFNDVGTQKEVLTISRYIFDKFIQEKRIYINGHNFYTGQPLTYKTGLSGIGLSVSETGNGPIFSLKNNQTVYAVNYANDYIGISTIGFTSSVGIGTTLNSLYFRLPTTNIGKDHSFETKYPIILGKVENYSVTVSTEVPHELKLEDKIKFTYTPSFEEEIILRYDKNIKKITTELLNFDSTKVDTLTNEIYLPNNNLKTGDKIVYYTNNQSSIGNLINNNTYFVIKNNPDTIKLSNYYYDSILGLSISLSTIGTGIHSFALINPPLKVTKGNTVKVILQNISNMRLKLYKDFNFSIEYNDIDYILPNGDYLINTNNKIFSREVYYNLIPFENSSIDEKSITSDEEVIGKNKIEILINDFEQFENIIVPKNETEFKFNLNKKPRLLSINNLNSISYDTNSLFALGPISDIKINFGGRNYRKVPKISSISSINGYGALIAPSSSTIGKINLIESSKISFDYPTDTTLIPFFSIPAVCEITDILRINYIKILDGGKNYNTAPSLKVIGNDEIKLSANIQSGSVVSVDVINNVQNLSSPLEIISLKNSNGFDIDDISVGIGNSLITIELVNTNNQQYPLINSGYGSTEVIFPFSVGDEIFIENCRIEENDKDNFNSKNYNYKFFKVVGVSTENFTITYDSDGISSNFGTYNNNNGYGYVSNKKDIPKFEMIVSDDANYISGEKVSSTNFEGTVMDNGWDNDINQLRLIDCVGELLPGDKLFGSKSKLNGKVLNVNQFNLYSSLGVHKNKVTSNQLNNSLTNDYLIRLSDNFYYQRFSYAINSEIPYSEWKEPIRSLNHPSGFKEFSDLNIISKPTETLKPNSVDLSIDLSINLDNEESFYLKNNLVLVTEENIFEDGSIENIIIGSESANVAGIGFVPIKGIALGPYILNKTNKVVGIDDISSQFTGITSDIGGEIVGLTSFSLKSNGVPLFHREFFGNDSNVISLETNLFTLLNHNFQTGQKLLYNCPENGKIGIKTTDLVDSSIIIINDQGNISVASTESNIITKVGTGIGSGIYEDGYNVGITTTIVGIGSTAPIGISARTIGLQNPFTPSFSSGIGTGARFTVLLTYDDLTGQPLSTSIVLRDGGSGYSIGDTVSIAGTYLFGKSPDNDLSFVVSKLSSTRIVGQANTSYIGVAVSSTSGTGSNAKLTVVRNQTGEISNVSVYDGGVGYALTDKLKISGSLIGGISPNDDYYFSPSSLGTNKLPSVVYVNKVNDNQFTLSGLSTLTKTSELDLESYGIGTHSLSYDDKNSSSIILIDNIIQSPIYYRNIELTLSKSVGIASTCIYITSGINSITTYDKLLINDEYMDIVQIGVGETNGVEVKRGIFGSSPKNHNINSLINVIRGDYNIVKDKIHFSTPPYGPIGPDLFKINSSFQGRVFSRSFDDLNQPNDKNFVLDDISKDFTGISATTFTLKSKNKNVIGIYTNTNGNGTEINNNPFILINNIPQISGSDFTIDTPSQNTIKFLSGVPNAGKIVRVSLSTSFGYQPLVGASATVTVSSAGTISSVQINGSGKGYREAPIISIASSIGVGAGLSAIIGIGGTIQSIIVTNPGSGYTNTSIPSVIIPQPPEYSDLNIIYYNGYSGLGTGAKASVKVGSGSSIVQFEIEENGISYKVGDVLKVSGITTNPLAGSKLNELKIIVEEIFTDKFSGFYPGQFIQFDTISKLFDGRKRKFTLYYTLNGVSEVVTFRVPNGSDLDLDKNIFVFINDILQEPGKSYTFTGNRIIFKEAPKKNSKCNILFYRGSVLDIEQVNPVKTLKPGDKVQIVENINDPFDITQFERVIKRINSSDDFDTFTYDSIGINTDITKARPISWEKQKYDKIINGVLYSKERPSLQSNIFPSTNLIKSVNEFDSEIYVNNAFPLFSKLDKLGEDLRNVTIIENREILPGLSTSIVSYGSSVSSIILNFAGVGYGVTINPKISISSSSLKIRDPIKYWKSSIGLTTNSSINSLVKSSAIVGVGSDDFVGLSTNGISWFEYKINSFSGINYNDIGFSLSNRYIAVGDKGKISSSVGIGTTFSSWQEVFKLKLSETLGVGEQIFEPSSYALDFKSITFSEQKQIWSVVGSSGTVFYGVGYATTSLYEKKITSSILNSVTTNDDVFVTVGTNGYIGISTNSVNWEQRASGLTFEVLNHIIWDGEKFIAVGNNSTIINSFDGQIWQKVSDVTPGLNFTKIDVYENKLYVSLIGNEKLYYSFDLINWEERSTNQSNIIKDLLFVDNVGDYGRYVLVGSSGTSIYANPDFNRATAHSSVVSGSISSISIINGGFGYSKNDPPAVLIESDKIKKEELISIKAKGDFGKIIGINTFVQGTPGIGTTSPKLEFVLKSEYYNNAGLGIGYSSLNEFTNEDGQSITYSQINVGDYFVILNSNSTVSHALTGITTSLGGMSNYPSSIVGTATTYLDGVYRAELVRSNSILGIVTVTCHFEPVYRSPGAGIVDINVGINSSGYYGDYSWGKIYDYQNRQRLNPKEFKVNTNNGLLGLSTSPQVYRTIPLK